MAGGVVAFSTTPQQAAAATFPGNTNSYYVTNPDAQTWYNLGCTWAQIDTGVIWRYVILDFGAQESGGFQLINVNHTYVSDATAEDVVEAYGRGWYACQAPGETLGLAMGTNSSVLDGAGTGGADDYGIELGQDVSVVASYLASQGYSSTVSAYGADDIEPAWSSYAVANSWEAGYSAAQTRAMFYYGSCDGCPTSGGSSGNQTWSQDGPWSDAYMKNLSATGIAEDVAFPEIYYDVNADQWKNISNYCNYSLGHSIDFIGAMSTAGTLSPQDSWSALQSLTGESTLGASYIGFQ